VHPADGEYALTTVFIRTDTYDYIRSLIDTVLTDFTGIYFPYDEIDMDSVVGELHNADMIRRYKTGQDGEKHGFIWISKGV
jgi:hypothetical protein